MPVTRIPVVLDQAEVMRVPAQLEGTYHLVGLLLYGSSLRLLECLSLRVKDVDLVRRELRIRRGKGQKDRVTMLPDVAGSLLGDHLVRVKAQAASSPPNGGSACHGRGGQAIGRREEGHLPHAPAFVRDALAGGWV